MKVARKAYVACGVLLASFGTSQVLAQDAVDTDTAPAFGDIIVTAEKRSTSLQKTAVAITSISAEQMERAGVRSLVDIQTLVPNVKIGSSNGFTQITIRGVGTSNLLPGAESPTAFNLNEVYVSRMLAQQTGLYDVSAMEVLRGPQGTLYGRNATAGSVNVSTTRPTDELSGYVQATFGNYDRRIEGAVGGPIAGDALMMRVAAFTDQRRGYGKNVTTGSQIDDKSAFGVRGTILAQPTETLDITLIAEYFKQDDRSSGLHYFADAADAGLPGGPTGFGSRPFFRLFGGTTLQNSFDMSNTADPRLQLETFAVTGIINLDLGAFGIKSITGYRDQKASIFTDISAGNRPVSTVLFGEDADQFSQELQFQYQSDSLSVTSGLYYFRENISPPSVVTLSGIHPFIAASADPTVPFYTVIAPSNLLKTEAAAAFMQANIKASEQLTIVVGGRYSWEKRNAQLSFFQRFGPPPLLPSTSPVPVNRVPLPALTAESFTPKIGLNFQATPDTLLYVSYSKGFKAGGFDTGDALGRSYQPEKLTAYEGGIKTSLADRRVRLNLAGFYYDYKGLQVQQIINNLPFTANAGSAEVYGIEAEIDAKLTDALSIGASGGYLHATYGTFITTSPLRPAAGLINFSGKTLTNAPEFSGSAYAEYRHLLANGELSLRGELEYSSRYFFSPDNANIMSQSPFTKGNATLTYAMNNGVKLTAYIKNIGNAYTKRTSTVNAGIVGYSVQGSVAPPRNYGLQASYRF